jgi:hypothetical protein
MASEVYLGAEAVVRRAAFCTSRSGSRVPERAGDEHTQQV